MAVETTEKFTCDTTRCKQSSEDRNQVMHVTVTYRLIDGSSGSEDHQFCGNHESKAMDALRSAGLVTGPPQMAPIAPPPEDLTQESIDARAEEDNIAARKTTAKGK